jgi:hypothetical protein
MAYCGRLAWAAMVLALSSPVYAQATKADEARAAELKKQGDDFMHESKFHEALKAYEDSFALVPNPAIHYNRARALQSDGDVVGALDAFDKFVATAPADLKAKVPNLDKMIADAKTHVSTLVIQCAVAGATVTVHGKNAGTTPVEPFRTDPGDTSFTVTAPGYVAYTQDVTLAPGEIAKIDVQLKKASSQETTSTPEPTPFDHTTPPPKTTEPETPAATGGSGWKTAGWVFGSVGVASVGVGMIFFGLALADKSSADPNCPGKVCNAAGRQSINEAWTFSSVSTVLVVVGAVALATSVTSFIISPKRASVQARVFVTPSFAGLGGSF